MVSFINFLIATTVILVNGEDSWLKGASAAEREFLSVAAKCKDVGAKFEISKDPNAKLPTEVYGYPAWIIVDSENRPVYQQECVNAKLIADNLEREVHNWDAKIKERDRLIKEGKIGEGLAVVLDPVLSSFSQRLIGKYQDQYKKEVSELKAADPDDKEGWVFKYTFIILTDVEGIICKNFKTKDYAANESYIAKNLAKPRLLPVQRQNLMLFRFKNQREQGDMTAALKTLEAAIAIAPETRVAEAARNMIKYYRDPIVIDDMEWREENNRPDFQAAVIDLTSVVKAPGKYTIKFVREAGRTSFRVNGKENDTFDYVYNGQGKPEFKCEMRGYGWFDGRGRIEVKQQF